MNNSLDKMIETMNLIGYTEATKESYIRRIKSFFKYINKSNDDITMYDFREYIKYSKFDKKLSSGTICIYISALRIFWLYQMEKQWDKNIVPRVKRYISIPVVLSVKEVQNILNSVTNPKHKAILALLYGSGLRVSEAVSLRIIDIDSENMQIFISKSKNKHDRYAILPKITLKYLRTYWKSCDPNPTYWLFEGQNSNNHLNVKSIKNTMLKIKSKLKISKKISAHTLRHCFATHLLEADYPLPYIQQMLGHLSIKTTSRYIHMTSKAMMNIQSPIDKHHGEN